MDKRKLMHSLLFIQISYLGRDSGHFLIMTNKGFNKMTQLMSEKRLSGITLLGGNGLIMLIIMWLVIAWIMILIFSTCQFSQYLQLLLLLFFRRKVPDKLLNILGNEEQT
ncbi:hypothetical protein KY289_000792 [Solanum tuberosum]|nr:hypothetical protein KY289_000792 [Solanum tuberosum]